jgi:hypothetical protein
MIIKEQWLLFLFDIEKFRKQDVYITDISETYRNLQFAKLVGISFFFVEKE